MKGLGSLDLKRKLKKILLIVSQSFLRPWQQERLLLAQSHTGSHIKPVKKTLDLWSPNPVIFVLYDGVSNRIIKKVFSFMVTVIKKVHLLGT